MRTAVKTAENTDHDDFAVWVIALSIFAGTFLTLANASLLTADRATHIRIGDRPVIRDPDHGAGCRRSLIERRDGDSLR
jgi:hypothetical protein